MYGYLLAPLRQLLAELTLVAAVLTLLELPLLYRVNALVLLFAVPVLDIELRQLFVLDAIDDALDASGLPERVLAGDTFRGCGFCCCGC